jgi:hypothetical protein
VRLPGDGLDVLVALKFVCQLDYAMPQRPVLATYSILAHETESWLVTRGVLIGRLKVPRNLLYPFTMLFQGCM